MFRLRAVDLFVLPEPATHLAAHSGNRVQIARKVRRNPCCWTSLVSRPLGANEADLSRATRRNMQRVGRVSRGSTSMKECPRFLTICRFLQAVRGRQQYASLSFIAFHHHLSSPFIASLWGRSASLCLKVDGFSRACSPLGHGEPAAHALLQRTDNKLASLMVWSVYNYVFMECVT